MKTAMKITKSQLLEGLENRQLMATFSVSNALDSGAGSLRDAITQANATAGADVINFTTPANGNSKLDLVTALPAITDPLTIDGTTQPGYIIGKKFEINASAASVGDSNCLRLGAVSTIRGLSLTLAKNSNVTDGFGNCIRLGAGSSGSVIEYNFIGLNPAQTAAGNKLGMLVESGNNLIRNNVISGNATGGVKLIGAGATGNTIAGNKIGTDLNGSVARINSGAGILFGSGSTSNVVGGPNAADRNIISSNFTGVSFDSTNHTSIVGNVVDGNYIGTDALGNTALGNSVGIGMNGGVNSVIKNNVISASTFSGITFGTDKAQNTTIKGNRIGMNAAGTAGLFNGDYAINIAVGINGVNIGAAGEGNWLVSNGGAGKGIVSLVPTDFVNVTNVDLKGNVFGILPNGSLAGNTGYAMNAGANVGNITVGGPNAADGNKFAGPTVAFIQFSDDTNTRFQNNWFGLNLEGTAGLGTTQTALRTVGATTIDQNKFARATTLLDVGSDGQISNNTFGLNAAGNAVISGSNYGVLSGSTSSLISGNTFAGMAARAIDVVGAPTITGNRFGTDTTGLVGLPLNEGVEIHGTGVIGGTNPGAGNVFGQISVRAIDLSDSGNVTVQGNLIGLNADQSIGFPITTGISAGSTNSPIIGGSVAGAGNIFARVSTAINLDFATGAIIRGNTIGLPGKPVGTGIQLANVGTTTIGGDTNADGNILTNILGKAIRTLGGANDKITIKRNLIHSNGNMAIDLGDDGLTANDALDADAGKQNFPLLLSADSNGGVQTVVQGLINSSASTPLVLDFYSADVASNEARTWLGSKTILTDAGGGAVFTHTLPFVVGNKYIVATATNIAGFPNGSTSELSPSVQVVGPADTTPPSVSSGQFQFETSQAVKLLFNEDLQLGSIAAADLQMKNTTTNITYTPSSFAYDMANKAITFSFASLLPDGNYTYTLPAGTVSDVAGNASNATYSNTTFVLAGDTDRNRSVNFDDLLRLAQNYGGTGKTFSQGDSNYDGKVDFDDLLTLAQRYGTSLFSAAPIGSSTAKGRARENPLLK